MKILRIIKNILLSLILLIIIFSTFIIYNEFFKSKKEIKDIVISEINDYGYVLNKSKSEYYKKCFNKLKLILNSGEINDDEYAKIISQMFISDLFTLSNKVSSSDIGGSQFIYAGFKNNFLKIARESLYNSVQSNLYKDRKQELPTVDDVKIIKFTKNKFKYGKITYEDAYFISVELSYEKELGYGKNYTIFLVKNGKKIEVVKLKEN